MSKGTMIPASLVIKDVKGKVVKNTAIAPADLGRAAHKYADMYPDCWVTVEATDLKYSSDYYSLAPKNMIKDEHLVAAEEMTLEQFMKKWYPKSKSPKAVDMERELAEEFAIDTEDTDDWHQEEEI